MVLTFCDLGEDLDLVRLDLQLLTYNTIFKSYFDVNIIFFHIIPCKLRWFLYLCSEKQDDLLQILI